MNPRAVVKKFVFVSSFVQRMQPGKLIQLFGIYPDRVDGGGYTKRES